MDSAFGILQNTQGCRGYTIPIVVGYNYWIYNPDSYSIQLLDIQSRYLLDTTTIIGNNYWIYNPNNYWIQLLDWIDNPNNFWIQLLDFNPNNYWIQLLLLDTTTGFTIPIIIGYNHRTG